MEQPVPVLSSASTSTRLVKRPKLAEEDVFAHLDTLFGADLHAKRVLSLSYCVIGVLHGASLAIHAIGQGLAQARGLAPKHAIKQVERLLRNKGVDVEALQGPWVRYLIGERTEIVCTLDWTEFDNDDQSTIALNLVTSHGRATPLLWKTVRKSEMKDQRNQHEDEILGRLRKIVPSSVRITVLADRGFGDQKLYRYASDLSIDFVIRFRECITVTDESGRAMTGADWVPINGQARAIRGARVTTDETPVPMVVCTKARAMKEAWCLATSRSDLTATAIVKLYGKRFTTEENFRDTKDPRYGLGLSSTHIKDPSKRDRLLLVCALAQALLTLLGAAAERVGFDRLLKASTTKKRTHSLFRQGLYWYGAIPMMDGDDLELLMKAFVDVLREHEVFALVLGAI